MADDPTELNWNLRLDDPIARSSIHLELFEITHAQYPSACFSVQLSSMRPSASWDVDRGGDFGVWIDEPELEHFVHALMLLEQSRQGEALLSSPHEFALRFRIIDRAGHLGVSATLEDRTSPDEMMHNRMTTYVEVDPGTLADIIGRFRDLLASLKS